MAHSLGEIAELVQGQLTGDAAITITGVNDLSRAESDQISFLGNSRYIKQALQSKAAAVLIPLSAAGEFPVAVIRTENPSKAFAQVAALFAPASPAWSAGIHPTALIAEDVDLGADLQIGPYVVIERGVRLEDGVHIGAGSYIGHQAVIGKGSFIYPNVNIRERSILGQRVIIHCGAVIGSDGFGYEFEAGRYLKVPQTGFVQIDDDVEIGANTTIDRGRFDKTWIQTGCKIDNLVMIAHNVVIGAHSVIVAQVGISGSSALGKYNTVAGQSALVGHVKTADKVTITAWTAVTKDITEPGVYRGGPAKPVRESMEIEALTQRLPEIYQRLKVLEKSAQLKNEGRQ
jgi:UDP-3-O-[3-hydroxymyristoyl] glucosamine N-acyltransferase